MCKYNAIIIYTLTEIAFGSANDVGEVCSCIGVLGWDVIMGVFGELYRSGNMAKNSCA